MVTFSEVPDEISLCINITNCPNHCAHCHSSYLWDDIGEPLNETSLEALIKENTGITAVCFMGGDISPSEVNKLALWTMQHYPSIKVGWYSGRDIISPEINLEYFGFIKYGHYDFRKGPLNKETTNQVMLRIHRKEGRTITENITERFWSK